MPANVPTMLEAGNVAPEPPDPDAPGVQAKRVAQLVESFGINTFSSLDTGNIWGSWPADYRPPTVIAAVNWMLNGSGHAFRFREYHYSGREGMQQLWWQQVLAGLPGSQISFCIGANGGVNDVTTMLKLGQDCGAPWLEGLNEPNTDFGWGNVPLSTTYAIQEAVAAEAGSFTVLGPSIVTGTPHPEGWIYGYCGDRLDEMNGMMEWGNGHYYPPACPDVPYTGYSINEYIDGLGTAYAQKQIALTEYHPTLYAAGTLAVKQEIMRLAGRIRKGQPQQSVPSFRASEDRDPYWLLMTLLRCGKNGTAGVWWYALFDYGTTYECGLFPKDANNPRSSAQAMRNLCTVCADHGDRRGFTPGKLEVSVAGLDGDWWDLYQASDGRFLIPLWRAAEHPDAASIPVTVTLTKAAQSIEHVDLLAGSQPVERWSATKQMTVDLPSGTHMLVVRP